MSGSDELVPLRGGVVLPIPAIARVIDLKFRGVELWRDDEGYLRATPGAKLTEDDRAFLRANRDALLRAIEYRAEWPPC